MIKTILRVWIDAATNDTINKEYGSLIVDGVTIREVVYYDKYHKFSVPITISLQQNTGKIIVGISTVVVLNFNSFQTGKALNKDTEITSFEEDSITRTFPFSYAAHLTETILLGVIAGRFPNQTLHWDNEKARFQEEAANAFLDSEYRVF